MPVLINFTFMLQVKYWQSDDDREESDMYELTVLEMKSDIDAGFVKFESKSFSFVIH